MVDGRCYPYDIALSCGVFRIMVELVGLSVSSASERCKSLTALFVSRQHVLVGPVALHGAGVSVHLRGGRRPPLPDLRRPAVRLPGRRGTLSQLRGTVEPGELLWVLIDYVQAA